MDGEGSQYKFVGTVECFEVLAGVTRCFLIRVGIRRRKGNVMAIGTVRRISS